MAWLDRQRPADLFTTSITKAEVLYGVALLPAGKRQTALRAAAEKMFEQDFAGRILSFDSAAASYFAEIVASRRRSGKPINHPDAQIPAIARVHGYSIATRDVSDFQDCGITLINPWEG
jgi:predicted nucleic acid-binding protein